ncbi:sigma-70 family RNA polymerase sigma factor [Cyanobium sp. CH-040]|uniref:sigma-70 family RNA polymerase sigma factor n=1 Tax=Cyanobium sp. CH-040 TaxID=2823708 RepID=UPI0020CF42BE|nr:sigma-70 family RNA polymerase sigma factor [Cyanobium sp. CH-040]MCP9927605.1 sigma-70 family RNA polymerase sigma factor [Cyanobium sp. CH-040]
MSRSLCRVHAAGSQTSAHRPRAGQADPASAGGAAAGTHHQRNRALLRELGRSRRCEARLHWRNALVVNNLALVRLVASRESRRTGRPFDELHATGCLGLIRAVDGFDAARGVALSSFAIPYIRGAMLQEQRDRDQPLHTPRRLRELQRRAEKLVEQRRGAGLAGLADHELAAALGCSLERLKEAGRVKRALRVSSLDQPAPGTGDDADAPPWLELVAAPGEPWDEDGADGQRGWLRRALRRLEPAQRELLEGRWIDGLSWRELARLQGCSSVVCRERAQTLLARLRAEAGAGSATEAEACGHAASQPQASIASAAARAV